MKKALWRGVLCVGAAIVGLPLVASIPAQAGTSTYIPAQFVAKQYTEGLGRIPDQPGWQSAVNYFTQNGCTAASLANYGAALYTSPEFTGLGYDNNSRVFTLYRGALNREPDQSGFANWTTQLADGLAWSTVVQKFFTSSEFTALVPKICSGTVDGSGSSYYFGTYPAIALPTTGSGFTGTESALQTQLNASPSGGTVTLAQRALIVLNQPLNIPAGVTLTTAGNPDPRHYANMARLVRGSDFAKPAKLISMVQAQKTASLTNVQVDGARDTPGNTAPLEDVITYGGGTTVRGDVLANSQGPNTLYLFGGFNGYPCASESVTGNLVTAYSSDHYLANDWTDGIADDCEGATISNNQVVDATDVGIVVYRNTTTSAQASTVKGNYVLSAGNSMYGGLGFDPLFETSGSAQTFSFAGSSLTGNTVWTGPDSHLDIAITDGSRAWFAGTYTADTGTGASVTGNTTGTQSARVQIGVGVNGMLNTTVTGNTLTLTHVTAGKCPKDNFAAEVTAGHASGTFNPQPTDVNFDGCV